MYMKTSTLLAGAFAMCALSAPIVQRDSNPEPQATTQNTSTPAVTAAQLIQIAPETASCNGAPIPDECADATHAAAGLNSGFEKYGITSKGEQAAVIAYTLFESGNYKYNKNHFPAPGRPGQGTRMMAMPNWVQKYATAVAGASAVAAAGDATGVLALVNSDDAKSFGMASWFVTQCSPDIRAGLVSETSAGWQAFIEQCVGTDDTPARDQPWIAAKQILHG